MKLKLPRTRNGWSKLLWLTLRRCPIHHTRMHRDWPQYDDGTHYCFDCEGVSMWPVGFFNLLHRNWLATNKASAEQK